MAEQPRAGFEDDGTVPQITPPAHDRTAEQHVATGAYHTQQQAEPPTVTAPVDFLPRFGPPSEPNEIGTLGPYRVVRELGRGGMGAVYLGFDERLQRRVALKVMLPKFAAVDAAKHRFLREARAAADLAHDHVVTIHEVDERDGITYMAMQLLHGEPLDTHIKNHPHLDLTDILRIGRETALGLAAAHGKGLVHRDIKPANLWLEALNGRVKVLDFGIAKPVEGDRDETENTGEIVGTPAYMAPEQALGEKIDFRADLYSLGVVLYRLCTGRVPFTGATAMAVMNAAINTEATPVRELNPDVTEPLADLIRRLMAKRPENRPASAQAVAEELRQIELGRTAAITTTLQFVPVGPPAPPARGAIRTDPFLNIDVAPDSGPTVVHRSGPQPVQRPRAPKWPLIALAVLCLTVLALTPTLIRLMTPKGVLILDAAEGEAEVVVKKDGAVVVERSKGREFPLKVGENYTIELAEPKDGVRLVPDRFAITRNGRTTVKVRVERAAGPPRPKEVVVAEFQEVHGVTPVALKAWAGKLPRGTRPVWLSPRVGSKSPLIDAVAVPTPNEADWALDTLPDDQPEAFADRLRKGYQPALSVPLPPDGTLWLWVKAEQPRAPWTGVRAVAEERLALLRAADQRPGLVTATLVGAEVLFTADAVPAAQQAWDSFLDVSADELAERMAEYRAKGWRPAGVTVHRNRTPVRYAAVFRENRPSVEWEFTPGLTVGEYERQLADRRLRGFRPQCVGSQDGPGGPKYTVVWESLLDQDRRAAEWVLTSRGTVRVNDQPGELSAIGELPAEPFVLTAATLPVTGDWNEADLGLLRHCKSLKGLWVRHPRVKDAALSFLRDLPNLTLLELAKSPISDAGLDAFQHATDLVGLGLVQTGIHDAGLAVVGRFRKLIWLNLSGNAIGDAGLKHLDHLGNLQKLDLKDTQVTAAGVKALAAKIPLCEITWGGGVEAPLLTPAAIERIAAEAVLAADGGVQINDRLEVIRKTSDLPPEGYRLTGVDLRGSGKADGALLSLFRLCPNVKSLNLDNVPLGDGELEPLANWDALTFLDLGGTRVTDRGLANFQRCKGLRTLSVAHTGVGPEGLGHFKDCKSLRQLNLTGVNLKTGGLDVFARSQSLARLELRDSQLADADLAALDGMAQLREVTLTRTAVTKTGVAALAARLPRCRVVLNDSTAGPLTDRWGAVWALSFGGAVRVNGATTDTVAVKDLPRGPFALTYFRIPPTAAVTDADLAYLAACENVEEVVLHSGSLADAGLAHLRGFKKLRTLTLAQTKVTNGGLVYLKELPTLVALYIDDMPLTDAGLPALEACRNLRTLAIVRTHATEEKVAELAAKRPDCTIDWNGKVFNPAPK